MWAGRGSIKEAVLGKHNEHHFVGEEKLIRQLNPYGYSPRTMQSSSTVSVGGSLAVNAHGITTDHCGAESVICFTLIKWDGSEVGCGGIGWCPVVASDGCSSSCMVCVCYGVCNTSEREGPNPGGTEKHSEGNA